MLSILLKRIFKRLSNSRRPVWLHGRTQGIRFLYNSLFLPVEYWIDRHDLLDVAVWISLQTAHMIRHQVVLIHLKGAVATCHIGLGLGELRERWISGLFFFVEIDTCDHLHRGFAVDVMVVDWVEWGVWRHWIQCVIVILQVVVLEILDSLDKTLKFFSSRW